MTLPAGSLLFPDAAAAQTAVDTAAAQLSSGPFDPAKVIDLARAMSKQPQKKLSLDLPDSVQNLTFEQYASIRRVPETNIWANIKTGFAIEPLHRGFIFNSPMQLFAVEDGAVQRIYYDPTEFSFGKITPPTAPKDFGFAGFRILQTGGEGTREAAVFYGAGFYQTIARGQTPGVAARGLSIRTAIRRRKSLRISSRPGSSVRCLPPTSWSFTGCSIRKASPAPIASPSGPAR
jgi:glucans biosynthesis protein